MSDTIRRQAAIGAVDEYEREQNRDIYAGEDFAIEGIREKIKALPSAGQIVKLTENTIKVNYPEWGKTNRIILTDEDTIFCKEFYCGEDTDIQDPEDIVRGCISLMQRLMYKFEEWLEWKGIEVDSKEEAFWTEIPYFEIVRVLLLYHTNHGGGASTRELCRKLGFDFSETVVFRDTRREE